MKIIKDIPAKIIVFFYGSLFVLLIITTIISSLSNKVGGDDKPILEESVLKPDIADNIKLLPTATKATLETKIAETINYEKLTDKFKEIPLAESTDGYKYRIDQYVVWHGEGNEPDKGYQVYLFNDKGETKSFGEGVLSTELSHDWKVVIEKKLHEEDFK